MSMYMTNHAFINEYADSDELLEFIENASNELESSLAKYKANKRKLEMRAFFEQAEDVDMFLEAEEKGLFASIGSAIIELAKKIAEFAGKIVKSILQTTGLMKSDVDKVNQIIAQHPELRNDIVHGIEAEWYTYEDIAKYEKDVVALIQMLENEKEDHATVWEKFAKLSDGFVKKAGPIVAAGTTVVGLLKLLPSINGMAKKSGDVLSEWGGKVKEIGGKITGKGNNGGNNASTNAATQQKIINQATSNMTKAAQANAKAQGKLRTYLSHKTGAANKPNNGGNKK